MNHADFKRSLILTVLAVVGVAVPLSAQPRYVLNDLGILSGAEASEGDGINASGQVVGTSKRGFRTAPNAVINSATDDLGALGGVGSKALGINSSGQVVGQANFSGDQITHAYRTAPNAAINPTTDDLGKLSGTGSVALSINASGSAVGYAGLTGDFFTHAFRVAPHSAINPLTDDLGTLGGMSSKAFGINDSGYVVGQADLASGIHRHAFRTSPNQLIHPLTDDLGPLSYRDSSAAGINNFGQVVGYYETGSGVHHAFRTFPYAAVNPAADDLGTLGGAFSEAQGINNSGDVVGTSTISDNNTLHAFVYKGGVMYDLNNQVYGPPGWWLDTAFGINDAGQIVGYGFHDGVTRAFRLDPLVTVDILVNPGTPRPASCNIDSEGAIPVAILGSATFDVTIIDPTSVQFGPKGAKSSRTPVLQDVNHDGKLDLVLYFAPHSAGIGCTDTSVALIGTTHSKQLLFTGSEVIKTTHTFPCQRCTSTFSDNFNRADGVVGNGWSDTAGNRNGSLVIRNGALSTPGPDGGAGIHRPINLSGPVTVSATLTQENGFGGLLKRYSLSFGFGPFDVGFARGDQNYNDSRVIINGTQFFSSFQFGSSLAVTITLNPDGSVKGSVSGSGNTFDFGAGPQTVVVPGPDFAIGLDFPDSRSGVITNATVDNLTIAYACGT